jgi:hypothetical protein
MGTYSSLQITECPWYLAPCIQSGTPLLLGTDSFLLQLPIEGSIEQRDLLIDSRKLQPWLVWNVYFFGHELQYYTLFGSPTGINQNRYSTDAYTGSMAVQYFQFGNIGKASQHCQGYVTWSLELACSAVRHQLYPGQLLYNMVTLSALEHVPVVLMNTASGAACLQGISVQELSRYSVEVDTITKSMMALAELQPWPSWESSSNKKILCESFPAYNGLLHVSLSSIGPDFDSKKWFGYWKEWVPILSFFFSSVPLNPPKGIGALLSFFDFFTQTEAKRRHAATPDYYCILCLDNADCFDHLCVDQDYYNNVFCDRVHSGHNYYLACAACYLNIIKVCLDNDTHRDLGKVVNHQVPWDPGGSTMHRLGVKPRFKEGGMLATLLLADGPPRLGQALFGSQARWRHIYTSMTATGELGLDLDGFGLHSLGLPSSSDSSSFLCNG